MCVHGVAFGHLTAAARLGVRAGREINPIGFEQVLGHRFDARRSVDFEGDAPSKVIRRGAATTVKDKVPPKFQGENSELTCDVERRALTR